MARSVVYGSPSCAFSVNLGDKSRGPELPQVLLQGQPWSAGGYSPTPADIRSVREAGLGMEALAVAGSRTVTEPRARVRVMGYRFAVVPGDRCGGGSP